MKTRIVLAIAVLILNASLLSAPASAKPGCAATFPIVLGVGY